MDTAFGHIDQAPVWPEALYNALKYFARLFPDKEIFISGNGCVDEADGVARAQYISEHISQVQRAYHDGVNVVSYTCWSITSHREWGLKFSPDSDFGLYHIELDNDPAVKRVPTPAAAIYQQIIEKRGAM